LLVTLTNHIGATSQRLVQKGNKDKITLLDNNYEEVGIQNIDIKRFNYKMNPKMR